MLMEVDIKMMNLSSREKKILFLLNSKHGIVTGKELSSKLGVSERTIRSDIKDINGLLADSGISVEAVPGKGYSFNVSDRALLIEIFSEEQNYITKEDRISALLLKLLRQEAWYEIGVLEDEMFVSNTTLEKDLKVLGKQITYQHPHLQILRRGNKIKLEDDEQKKRDLFTRFYARNWDYDSKDGVIFNQDGFGADLLEEIQDLVKAQLNKSGLYLDDFAFIYLTIAIAVMMFRVKSGHIVNTNDEEPTIDEDIECILDELKVIENVELSKGEYVYLSEIKKQLVFLCLKTYSKNFVLNNTNIICHTIVNELLENVLMEFGMDFTEDDKLFVDLTRHVQALISGIVAPHTQNHLFGYELRKNNEYLAKIAKYMRQYLCEKCQIELGLEEEDYLLPFLILSEEALYKRKRGQGIPTAVISHYNESITHYLMEILKRNYGGYLKLYGPYAQYNKELIDKDIKFILTTVKLDDFSEMFKVPALTISPLLTVEDREKIEEMLHLVGNKLLGLSSEK